MQTTFRVLVDPAVELAPEQRLAAAVIGRAVLDLAHPEDHQRRRAAAFLAASDGLRFWCGVARLDPAVLLARLSGRAK